MELAYVKGIEGVDLGNFEAMKDKIHARLLNSKYRDVYTYVRINVVDDIWKTFFLDIPRQNGTACVSVTYDVLRKWNVDVDDVAAAAEENDRGRFSLCDFGEMFGMQMPGPRMAAVTSPSKYYGAAAILDPSAQAALVERFPAGFLCIPSSVHEWIIIQAGDIDAADITSIIADANADPEIVRPDERLGDVPYVIQGGRLVRAVKEVAVACV